MILKQYHVHVADSEGIDRLLWTHCNRMVDGISHDSCIPLGSVAGIYDPCHDDNCGIRALTHA